MKIKEGYNEWAQTYDTNQNKTRDLEGHALKEILHPLNFGSCLEIGCGTGKNTQWLATHAKEVTAVDFSEEMLSKARKKVSSEKVHFHQADVTQPWNFVSDTYDLITFSLVLEHIENLNFIFKQAAQVVKTNGYCYIGELHPFKQYMGTKARFETDAEIKVLTCFIHNISDFVLAAKNHGFEIADLREFSHPEDSTSLPRILTLLFRKAG